MMNNDPLQDPCHNQFITREKVLTTLVTFLKCTQLSNLWSFRLHSIYHNINGVHRLLL